jgi:hypothetical protein
MNLVVRPSLLGFVVGTRAALAFGMGLLVAGRIPESRRRAIALTLIVIGAATTIPAARALLASRARPKARWPGPAALGASRATSDTPLTEEVRR